MDKMACTALALIIAKADNNTQTLFQNIKIMQQNLAVAMTCKDAEKEFGENVVMPMQAVDPIPDAHKGFPPGAECYHRGATGSNLATVECG